MKKHIIIFGLLFLLSFSGYAQKDAGKCTLVTDHGYKEVVYKYAETMPAFNGDMIRYLSHNLHYVKQEIFQTKIHLRFVVEQDGSIKHVCALSPNGMVKALDLTPTEKDAVKMVEHMPKWKPDKCNDKNVCVEFILPIGIELE